MGKKTPLKLVTSTAPNSDQPPPNLGEHGSALWRTIISEYDVQDSGGREMLRQACAALDRAEGLAASIDHDGPVIYTKGGPRDHPALKHELASRAFVCRTLARLGLDVEPVRTGPGRPPMRGFQG
jgi:hypothetical protein